MSQLYSLRVVASLSARLRNTTGSSGKPLDTSQCCQNADHYSSCVVYLLLQLLKSATRSAIAHCAHSQIQTYERAFMWCLTHD